METQKTKTETKTETKAETESFFKSLSAEEKSPATIAKYRRDIAEFRHYLGGGDLCKEAVLRYRDELCARYRVSSVNSILSSLNRYFAFTGRHECRVKTLKMQKNLFASKEKELSPTEYEKLLSAAKGRGDVRLYYLMQTICATGIRVSELCFVTLEAVSAGFADIACKGKRRRIFLPGALCRALSKYARKKKIKSGAIFITRSGKPLDRSNIWSAMKKLCRAAGWRRKRFSRTICGIFLPARIIRAIKILCGLPTFWVIRASTPRAFTPWKTATFTAVRSKCSGFCGAERRKSTYGSSPERSEKPEK